MALLVGVVLDIDKVVNHGLVGQLVQEWADRVKTSLQYQQLSLCLSLETESCKLNLSIMTTLQKKVGVFYSCLVPLFFFSLYKGN